ncbi:hypothetical protein DPEC_G00087860 [Dallia pectoralis]|uniref:Uncharacterized protein n=1 Tax=Dallia pectoralis TaxID=75939 RepID=A0ACC2H052_DALPE|nr:hypothetical protein DPEC_G00087860 [Dallia pectoralis]
MRFGKTALRFSCVWKIYALNQDGATISEAYGLSKKLCDRAFLQLLEFFFFLMPEVDVFYNILQKRTIDASGISSALTRFKENVQNMRKRTNEWAAPVHDGTEEPGQRVTNTSLPSWLTARYSHNLSRHFLQLKRGKS